MALIHHRLQTVRKLAQNSGNLFGRAALAHAVLVHAVLLEFVHDDGGEQTAGRSSLIEAENTAGLRVQTFLLLDQRRCLDETTLARFALKRGQLDEIVTLG